MTGENSEVSVFKAQIGVSGGVDCERSRDVVIRAKVVDVVDWKHDS